MAPLRAPQLIISPFIGRWRRIKCAAPILALREQCFNWTGRRHLLAAGLGYSNLARSANRSTGRRALGRRLGRAQALAICLIDSPVARGQVAVLLFEL